MRTISLRYRWAALLVGCLAVLLIFLQLNVRAANPPPGSGSIGLEGTISSAPPSQAPTISSPGNGSSFNSIPITLNGICKTGLLIKIFDNGVLAGSVVCTNGSYSLQIDLFNGQNQLVSIGYDALDQASPSSPTITVTFNDAQFLQYGTQLTLSSPYAERGAPPFSQITWPIIINGGNAPYAVSVDWGDSSSNELLSEATPGVSQINHIYKTAGVYGVIIKAVDKNGETAFLQLVGQATGALQSNSSSNNSKNNSTPGSTKVLWWPPLIMIPLLIASFWIGKKHEHQIIQDQYEKEE